MGDYRELLAWQRARTLTGAIYRATEAFPMRERFGLAAQMRRASVSVASNIAEGAGRGSDPELRRFLQIARGSLRELQAQITIAADLRLISDNCSERLSESVAETARLICGLLRSYAHRSQP